MPGDKKNPQNAADDDARVEELIYRAMLRRGWVIPATPGEVARLESEIDKSTFELPASLEDPYAVLSRGTGLRRTATQIPADDDTVDLLTRAAREGEEITPLVEERMRKDRKNAECESRDGNT